ncbi:MAG: M20/M25/M40 family metallo-hydrolase [Gemmatimonadetes bacterium]|nr:M20/M25/M40 family metallo-hydrolase [Gemmatimonadota bacterium]NIQ54615.1 M20/M25/M40 family metallo-hydrolase [Gemmatimonadota bacterium]NIU74821.1 M20/M25/M40 family metallo-hydrolase [Gammaproteobacteria bacterium]NIX44720.1 M20/M25/M40 family metallo-hydrolase [Gemmatimonadota bacterium]NIY08954.1 M20/M25/M40 family metallo-hydrolase [Gemmatimonadota bacterium]
MPLVLVALALAAPPVRAQDAEGAAVARWVEANRAELVDRLVEFLRIPNVAGDRPAIRRNVDWLVSAMEARGIRTRVLETDSEPMVYGELPAPGARTTLLFYCHYDGQPADPAAWTGHAPWDPVLRDGSLADGAGVIPWPADGGYRDDWRVYGRSASDDKSPIVMLLSALDALRAAGTPPDVNLKFLFEGNEEAGSPHMRSLIAGHGDLLRADLVVMADGPEHGSGRPTLVYGARGIVTTRLIVYGPERPLHSGHFGNWAPNPAMRLAALLASMKDRDGRVLVEGFYDDVAPLSDAERAALRAVPADAPTDYGFAAPEGWAGRLRLEATSLPSLNVRGMGAGWIGPETRTIVPDSAVAEIDLRLVPDIEPGAQVARLRRHVERQGYHLAAGPPTAHERASHPRLARLVDLRDGYPGMRTPMDHPVARRIARGVGRFTGAEPVHVPMLGGSVPAVWFPVEAGTPVLLVPTVNPDNNQHSPNENLRLGHFFDGIVTLAAVMRIGRPSS